MTLTATEFADGSFVFASRSAPGLWRAADPDGKNLRVPDEGQGGRLVQALYTSEEAAVAALRERGYGR